MTQIDRSLRQALRADGVVIEAMDTGAACRTYNVLMAEGRRVAAALIAVGLPRAIVGPLPIRPHHRAPCSPTLTARSQFGACGMEGTSHPASAPR